MKNFIKKEKGITLIALVITIIVLLILAGVAISMLSGENGIINNVNSAKTDTKEAEQDEADKLLGYEDTIKEHIDGKVKVEYLEGTNLRLNVPYYMSGVEGTIVEITFYSEKQADYVLNGTTMKLPYEVEDGVLKASGMELQIIKEEENDILILDSTNQLFATSTNGLKYFNGEKYVKGNNYLILNADSNEFMHETVGGSATQNSVNTPVAYNGQVYCVSVSFGDGIEHKITSTDNFETVLINGDIYTKSAE